MSDSHKKAEFLEAGERIELLGQEGPILSDGRKTKPEKKGRAASSLGTEYDRNIFSPGPLTSSGQVPEDKIHVINPVAEFSEGVPSITRMMASAGSKYSLVGVETMEKSKPTATPFSKRPDPPVNRKRDELSRALSRESARKS